MSYQNVWNESAPNGAVVAANTLDTIIQSLKRDIRERIESIGGIADFASADPVKFSKLALNHDAIGKIVAGSSGGFAVRNAADSANTFAVDNDGVISIYGGLSFANPSADFGTNAARAGTGFFENMNLANGGSLQFRNAADSGNEVAVSLDSSDILNIRSPATKEIDFFIGSTNIWRMNSAGTLYAVGGSRNIGDASQTANPQTIWADARVTTSRIGPQSGSTAFEFALGGTVVWTITQAGHIIPGASYDIGIDSTSEPRAVYASDMVQSRIKMQIKASGVVASIRQAASIARFGTETSHPLDITLNDITRWHFEVAGKFRPAGDNTQDFGDATHQIKDIYVKGKTYLNEVPYSWPAAAPTHGTNLRADSAGNLTWVTAFPLQLFYAGM